MSYQLQVYGYLWSGATATYVYSPEKPISTDAEATREAHDFAHVLDWRLVKIEEMRTSSVRGRKRLTSCHRTETTLKGFRHGMTVERFYQLLDGA